jgi:hypothetical protein
MRIFMSCLPKLKAVSNGMVKIVVGDTGNEAALKAPQLT